jgi:hypothetical protein
MSQNTDNGSSQRGESSAIERYQAKRPVVYTDSKELLSLRDQGNSEIVPMVIQDAYIEPSNPQTSIQSIESSDHPLFAHYEPKVTLEPKQQPDPQNLEMFKQALKLSVSNSGNTNIVTRVEHHHHYANPKPVERKTNAFQNTIANLPPVMEALIFFSVILLFFLGSTAIVILMFDNSQPKTEVSRHE